jgi:hypothetical protein
VLVATALAYYNSKTVTTVKCFIVQAPGDSSFLLEWHLTPSLKQQAWM